MSILRDIVRSVVVFLLVLGAMLLLAVSYAHASDWQFVATDSQGRVVYTNCAVDRITCQDEINAIHRSWLAPELREFNMHCEPKPGCRPYSDLVIRGYNDR